MYRFNQYTVKDQLLQIAYMADNVKRGWNPILICYEKKNGSAHALVGYALEKGSFESSSSGKIYDHRILTYDCNRINWDEERCIYFNLGTDEWEIPHYDEVSSYDEAWFQCATNDTRIFDAVDEYVDVQFPMISIDTDSYVVIRKTNGNEQWLVDPKTGEVTGSSKLLVYHDIETDGEENKSSKLNVFLPDSSSDYVFETKSGSAAELDLKVQYNGKYLSVNTKSAKGATISFDGSASVKGNEGEFTITAASDDLQEENKFDSFTIKGSNKGNTSLSLAKSGIIVEGNNTKGVLVNASNAAQTGTTRIEETIYKELSNNKADYTAPGDVNDDGNINGADAGVLNRYASGWQGYADKIKNMDVADMNGDGKVNGADAGILSRYVSGCDGYDKYFTSRY
ncbi:MAG: dockerin type I repeat-containing protein [Ruminococcus sp.]|nr:dockerin type I repeat-containing protein [Ruminococcus sp.]